MMYSINMVMNWNGPVGKNKKPFDEKLQEVREHNHDKIRYRLRKQEDEDAQRRLEEYLKYAMRKNDEDS